MADPAGGDRSSLARDLEQARAMLEAALARRDARAAEALRVRYAALERRWRERARRDLDALHLAMPADARAAPATLDANIYPIGGAAAPSPGVGLCLSGGGSRAASASMGMLRGLRYLGLLDRVTVLSTVSGGGWAGIPFTYLPPDISDDEFLGGVVADPRDLTWCHERGQDPARALDVLSELALGSLATRLGLVEFLAKAVELEVRYRDSPHVLWCRAVGALVLEPFGLGDVSASGTPATYFSGTRQWLETAILDGGRNPGLLPSDFHLVSDRRRPALVTNSTLFWPPGVHPRRPAPGTPPLQLYPFEATSTGAGMPLPLEGPLGGGWVDPFAFGGAAPVQAPDADRVIVPTPPGRFALSDIAGTSSAAFVGPLIERFGAQFPWLEDIDPVYSYWPVTPAGSPRAQTCFFGDGANLENTGVMALLRRRMSRIVAAVNAETPLSRDPATGQVVVDSQLPPLFGLQPWRAGDGYVPYPRRPAPVSPSAAPFRDNQVFEPATFQALVEALWALHQAGGSAIARQSALTVRDNPRFGIQGAGPVDVLWLYNNPVAAFRDRLADTVRIGMDADPTLYGTFPNYDTILQLHLTTRQVNLLAHLSCWNVINEQPIGALPPNAELFRAIFDDA
jgi:Patatin-like phospholipase